MRNNEPRDCGEALAGRTTEVTPRSVAIAISASIELSARADAGGAVSIEPGEILSERVTWQMSAAHTPYGLELEELFAAALRRRMRYRRLSDIALAVAGDGGLYPSGGILRRHRETARVRHFRDQCVVPWMVCRCCKNRRVDGPAPEQGDLVSQWIGWSRATLRRRVRETTTARVDSRQRN